MTDTTTIETYTARELLDSLPLIKEVKKSKGHIYYHPWGCDRIPLVGLNGDIRRVTPINGGTLEPEDFDRYMFLPLNILRHALEQWPEGEEVSITRRIEIERGVMRSDYTEIKCVEYVELSGGSYRLRLRGVREVCFRKDRGRGKRPFKREWFTTTRERLLEQRKRREEEEEKHKKWEEEGRFPWWKVQSLKGKV